MALRIRQAWAQLAGGDPNAARATLAPLAPGSDRERVAHLLAQAAAAWFSGDAAEAGRSAGEGPSLSLEQGLAREARMAVQIQAMVAHSTGDWPAALRRGLDASLLAPDLADTLFDGHLCVAEYALTSGTPLDRVRAAAEELHTDSLRSGARRAQVLAATLLGEVALVTDQISEADARLREAVGQSRELGAVSAEARARVRRGGGLRARRERGAVSTEARASVRLGEALRARGETADGDALLADALVLARWSPISGHLLPLGYVAVVPASQDTER